VVPADSDGISRVPPYSGSCQGRTTVFAYGAFTLYSGHFQGLPLTIVFVTPRYHCSSTKTTPTTPTRLSLQAVTPGWFRLIPFRSPLLRESIFLSLPQGTEMFHFPCLPSLPYFIQVRIRAHYHTWVPPFGNPRVKGCSAPYRGLSQPTASFIGSQRQGIRHAPLVT